jgi:organic hydroperoxide reductase OsmC/OhrA
MHSSSFLEADLPVEANRHLFRPYTTTGEGRNGPKRTAKQTQTQITIHYTEQQQQQQQQHPDNLLQVSLATRTNQGSERIVII